MAKAKSGKIVRRLALTDTAMSVVSSVEFVSVGRGFRASVNGLQVDGKPSFDAAQAVGERLRILEKGAPFALGDFLVWVERAFSEHDRWAQIVDYSSGWSKTTCDNYRWIAGRIARDIRRMDRLGIRHHQLVAALPPARQKHWLDKAAADDDEQPWTVAHLKLALDAGEELPIVGYYVVVKCETETSRNALMTKLEADGYGCKAVQKRAKRDAK